MIVRLPGLIDVHTHMREPGGEHKETFETGTSAALAGGITCLFAMPNTTPPITDETTFNNAIAAASKGAKCDYALFVGATHDNVEAVAPLYNRAAGLKIYVNDTFGSLRVEDFSAIKEHLENWKGKGPVCFHAEQDAMEKVVDIAMQSKSCAPIHICHVSKKSEIEAIKRYKEQGIKITCEVTPHHLFLTEADYQKQGSFADIRPRLATEEDRLALWANLDVVDCIATDHSPHTKEEKRSDKYPPGFPGLETTLPLMLTAVSEGRLSIDRLVELTNTNPRRIFNLPEQSDTYVEVDTEQEWVLPETGWYTKPNWSPFAGMKVTGKVMKTVYYGKTVFENGTVMTDTGTGRNIRD